jgi:hypothetical protein
MNCRRTLTQLQYPQSVKVLVVNTIAHAEEFLRLSQRELHSRLNSLQLEYVAAIRRLAEAAKEKQFRALRDAIKRLDPHLQPELKDIVGTYVGFDNLHCLANFAP